MLEMLKNKWTIALIVLILGASYIGGLEAKKDVASEVTTHYIANDLQK